MDTRRARSAVGVPGASCASVRLAAPAYAKLTSPQYANGLHGAPGSGSELRRAGDRGQHRAGLRQHAAEPHAEPPTSCRYLGLFTRWPPRAPDPRADHGHRAPGHRAPGHRRPGTARLGAGMPPTSTEGWDYAQQYAAAIRSRPGRPCGHAAVHQPRLHRTARIAAGRLAPEPVWETRQWSTFESWDPAWDRRHRRVRADLGAAHLHPGCHRGQPESSRSCTGRGSTTHPAENGDNAGPASSIDGSTVIPSGRLWAFAGYSRFATAPGRCGSGPAPAMAASHLIPRSAITGTVRWPIVALNIGGQPGPGHVHATGRDRDPARRLGGGPLPDRCHQRYRAAAWHHDPPRSVQP